MADWVGLLNVLGSLASLIGLSESIYNRSAARFQGTDGKRLALYIALTDITSTWKAIHNRYHVLLPDIQNLQAFLSDEEGLSRSTDSFTPAQLMRRVRQRTAFCGATRTFQNDLNVYLERPGSKIESISEADEKQLFAEVEKHLHHSTAKHVRAVRQNQKNALRAHHDVCEFMALIHPLTRSGSWSEEDKNTFAGPYSNFVGDYQEVILFSDLVLLNMVSLYEALAEGLLGDR